MEVQVVLVKLVDLVVMREVAMQYNYLLLGTHLQLVLHTDKVDIMVVVEQEEIKIM